MKPDTGNSDWIEIATSDSFVNVHIVEDLGTEAKKYSFAVSAENAKGESEKQITYCTKDPQEEFLMVAAIDFGTTYSGYAFSLRHEFQEDPLKVSTQTWTAPSGRLVSFKTPTTLLLKGNGDFDSFGYDAESAYTDLANDEEHEEYYFFRRFKMSLFQRKEVRK